MTIDEETKRMEAQRIAAGEVTVKEIAEKYDVAESTVRGWRKRYAGNEGDTIIVDNQSHNGTDEIHKLRKENKELNERVVFLEKVVEYFAAKNFKLSR